MGKSRDRTVAWPTGTLSISVTKPFLPFDSIYHSKLLPSENKEKNWAKYEELWVWGTDGTTKNQWQPKEETKKYLPGICDYISYTLLEKDEKLRGAFRKLTGLRKQKLESGWARDIKLGDGWTCENSQNFG